MDDNILKETKNMINDSKTILITSHQRPDGDAIGSVLGLGISLLDAGKNVQMVIADGIPRSFHHLSGCEQISKHIQGEFDISFVLDCSELQRVGNIFDEKTIPTFNIDHHTTNLYFGKINIVDQKAPATAEILYKLILAIGLNIPKTASDALLTGIITDTLGFRTSNMHPKTLRVVADLMERGSDLSYLYQKSLINKSFGAVKYWGAGLSGVQKEDHIVWTALTLEDRKRSGYPGRDDADLINLLSSIEETDVAVIFIEQENGKVKVSWRAKEGYDVSEIATSFGGGGHKPAAGAEIDGQLNKVKNEVLQATRNILKEQSNLGKNASLKHIKIEEMEGNKFVQSLK
jgi:phosphoesterase RecJ-like protein